MSAEQLSSVVAAQVDGTIHYHALPYGYQSSALFDIFVAWKERVIASDAFTTEPTGYLPPHLRVKHSSTRATSFIYITSRHATRITYPCQRQPVCPHDNLDYYLCGIALRDSTSPTLQDFALARYAQRHSASAPEFYITYWTPPPLGPKVPLALAPAATLTRIAARVSSAIVSRALPAFSSSPPLDLDEVYQLHLQSYPCL